MRLFGTGVPGGFQQGGAEMGVNKPFIFVNKPFILVTFAGQNLIFAENLTKI